MNVTPKETNSRMELSEKERPLTNTGEETNVHHTHLKFQVLGTETLKREHKEIEGTWISLAE